MRLPRRKFTFLRGFLIFILIFAWLFSGFPRIWQNPAFPPKIQEAQAAWDVPKIGTIVTVAAAVGSITLTEPTGVAQGDLMVATIAAKSNYAFTLPAGWALVATQQSSGDVDSTAGVASGVMAYIVRGASAPDLTFTRSTSADVGHGRITAYTGGFTTPYDAGSSATTLASVTPTTASITTAQAGELLVAMVACGDSYLTSAFDAATDPTTASGATDVTTAPTAGTWLERSDASTTTGADTALATADAIRAGAGSTGTLQATVATAAGHVLIVGAFKLAVVPTVSTQDASSVGETTATGNGTIVTTGGATTRRGFAYMVGTSGDPTTANSVAYDDGFFSTGAYTKGLTGLTSGTNYRVRAYVVNSAGTGYGTTVQILTKPAAPTSLNFTLVTTTTLRLNWTASTGAASYKVERCTGTGCSSWAEIATGVTNVYYDDTGRTGNTVYRYQVRATNATGDSAYSSGAEQLTLPDTPGTPTFSLVTATTLRVSWAPPTGDAASYKVARCSGASCTPTDVYTGVTNTYYDDFSLTCNTLYRYKIRGTNTTGDGAYSSIAEQTTGVCGSITVDIVNASYVSVGSPTMAMNNATLSFVCQTITGSFGTASQQIYVNNNDAADGGWIVNLAATNPTDVWDSTGTDFDFNEAGTGGCVDDGATTDADSLGGQMTVDPSGATLAIGQCGACSVTNVSLGTSEAFVETTNNDIDIVTGAAGSDDIGDWTVIGVSISQKIPKEQPVASDYDINMVLTITTL